MQHPIYSYIMAPLIYTLIKLLTESAEFYLTQDMIADRFKATYYDTQDTFDFIVVGAGSSGAVVANRLAKNNFTVLLLEAGGEMQPAQYIPSTSLLLVDKPELDWVHLTVPQTKACFSLKDRVSSWSAGKGLGGTSLINFLQYLRGHKKDFDNWANLTGDKSWSYEEVIPHFQAIEDFRGEFDSNEKGEVMIQPPPYTGMAEYFIKAGEELGYNRTNLNGQFDEGFSVIYNNIRNGRRDSTYNAFLHPMRNNPFLTIYKFSEVTKILMHGDENEVQGVEYIRHGEKKKAFSTKEVIISAGLVQSPKLLMLSGIGSRKDLESLGIETKFDQPFVGKNVQDHVSVYLGPFLVDKPVSMLMERDINSETMTEFIEHGTGPLSSSGTMATALISSRFAKAAGEGDWPDIQFILLGTGIYNNFDTDFAKAFHVQEKVLKQYFHNDKGKDSFQIIVSANRPIQRGEIRLKSSDPKDAVLIDPKYLHEDRDVEVMVDGIKKAMELVENTTSFGSIGARFTTSIFPGCEDVEFRSDDYWRCFIRHYTITLHHLVGSCSMGHPDSKEAVVNPQLQVIGTKHLRVIDSSIMPVVPVSNTAASAMMIGQKGATEILKLWKSNSEFLK